MPEREVAAAEHWSGKADVFVVIGSSLVVYPAAQMPMIAFEKGAKLAIINVTETPMDGLAEVVIREKAGQVLPLVVAAVKARRG